jgi:hypothetical protein
MFRTSRMPLSRALVTRNKLLTYVLCMRFGQACELDFVAEGRNAERVAAAFAAATPRVATAPGVVWDRTATRVLTMHWVDGCRVRVACMLVHCRTARC